MDLSIAKSALVPLLARTADCAAGKSPMQVLTCVILEATSGKLSVRATDNVVGVQAVVSAEVKKNGSAAVDARKLFHAAKDLPPGDIRLLLKDGKLVGNVGKSRFSLSAIDPNDFPTLPSAGDASPIAEIAANELAGLLNRAAYAADTDEARPHLCGSLLDAGADALRVVATDSRRLAVSCSKQAVAASRALAIPNRCVAELRKLCELVKDGAITLSATHADLFATAGDVTLSMKTSDSAMLAKWRVLLGSTDVSRKHKVTVARDLLISAVKRVSGVVGAGVVTRLDFTDGNLRVSATSGTNDGVDELECNAVGAYGFQCNPVLLADALSTFSDDEVELSLGGEVDPLIIVPCSGDEQTALVMPMKS